MTDKSRVEALQRHLQLQLTEQVEAIQPGENRRQTLHCSARADWSTRRDTAIVAGVPEFAIRA